MEKKYTKDEIDIKWRGYNDLYYLTKYILGYDLLVYRLHKPLCDFLQNEAKNGAVLLDMEPRDWFKTTIAIGFVILNIINNYEIRIKWNHKAMQKSREKMSEVKGHFERNHRFRYFYGNFVSPRWTMDAIIINKRKGIYAEPTLSIGGVDHEETSAHYDLFINDDLPGLKDMY